MSTRRILFRADASVQIGTGHVMRSLTLADALREQGATCHFLCRPHPGNLIALIASRGHEVSELPALAAGNGIQSDTDYAAWLGTDPARDAADCLAVLGDVPPADWLVLDHYALAQDWEERLRPRARRLMVLDDLANRAHDCDLLLDPGIGRGGADYAGLIPAHALLLAGPEHALLRPEFAARRAESLARRAVPQLQRILVTLGGSDMDNVTNRVLDALEVSHVPNETGVTVVMGASALWLEEVRARAAAMRLTTEVLVGVSNMAELMVASDLAIGAAGSTAWERCCLGLPTIQVVLAENQVGIAHSLEHSGYARTVRLDALLQDIPALLGTPETVSQVLALAKTAITDGHSAERVATLMIGNRL